MATPIYYFNMSGQLKTFIDRCAAVDVGGGKRGLRGKKLAVTMAYEAKIPLIPAVSTPFAAFRISAAIRAWN